MGRTYAFKANHTGWHSINWGDFPTWVQAVATIGALVAAGLAARYAYQTVNQVKRQVASTEEQLKTEREQIEIARKADKRERQALAATELRFQKTQLDARAPTVYAEARLDGFDASPDPSQFLRSVRAPFEVPDGQTHIFEVRVMVTFVNCSDLPARIEDIGAPPGTFDSLPPSRSLLLPPHTTAQQVWRNRFTALALRSSDDVQRPEYSQFRLQFWSRDLSQSVRDEFALNANLNFFRRDGSRLVVDPDPMNVLSEQVADLVRRVYERLDPPDEP